MMMDRTLNSCAEEWADNYDSLATVNDGSCYRFGCISEWAVVKHLATDDNGMTQVWMYGLLGR